MQQIVASCARSYDVDSREDTLVAQRTVELELHISRTLKLLEDDFVHFTTGVYQCGGYNGQRTAVFDVTGCSEETFRLVQCVGIHTSGENLSAGGRNRIVSACQSRDGV